jgi:hypothetical protein
MLLKVISYVVGQTIEYNPAGSGVVMFCDLSTIHRNSCLEEMRVLGEVKVSTAECLGGVAHGSPHSSGIGLD